MAGKVVSRPWYTFLQGLWKGTPTGQDGLVTAGASPFTYTASGRGFLIVQGGTVSLVQWLGTSRGSTAPRSTGVTQGCFPMSQGDQLIITYSVIPTLAWVPQ